jgi:hypothetical protein
VRVLRKEKLMGNTPVPADDTTWDYQLGYNEGVRAERDRIIALLGGHGADSLEQHNAHETECDVCQDHYGMGAAIVLIRGEN